MPRHTSSRVLGRIAAATGLLLVVAACSAGAGATLPPASVGRSPVAISPSPAPSDDAPPADGSVVPTALLDPVLADAATRTGADPSTIEVVKATAVTWNDGSLGCPKPGELYTQALVDGYQVIVDANGQRIDYRVPVNGGYKVCEGFVGG